MNSHTAETATRFKSRFIGFLLASLTLFEQAVGSMRCWWWISVGCAGILAWSARHAMNPDGLSYLDLASEALIQGPAELVNAHWSPGYPALIGVALLVFRPSPAQEVPLVHFSNVLIFLSTVSAFSFFLRLWLSVTFQGEAIDDKKKYVLPFAFATFLFFTLQFIGVSTVTPDLGVAAIVFLAAGITCRLSLPGSRWTHYLALGTVLGVGYYLKAAMLPLGMALLSILLFLPRSDGGHRKKLLLSFSIFCLIAAPLIVAISGRIGRLSFSEAGWHNYGGVVKRLEHPPHKLMERPLVIDFASPVKGTYPLHYDPGYWFAGTTVRFDLRGQVMALKMNLREFRKMISQSAVLVYAALTLCIFLIDRKLYPILPKNQWWLFVWPLTAFAMYLLVHVEPRYVGAFFVLLWVTVYGALICRLDRLVTKAVCTTVVFALLIPPAVDLAVTSVGMVQELSRSRQADYQIIATALNSLGVRKGDSLAVVGPGYDSYYARFAGLRVLGEMPNTEEFWRLSTPELEDVAERLASIGIKAVVAWNRPDTAAVADWSEFKISDSLRFSVLLLASE